MYRHRPLKLATLQVTAQLKASNTRLTTLKSEAGSAAHTQHQMLGQINALQQQAREADVLVVTKAPVQAVTGTLNGASNICHVDDPDLLCDLLSTEQSPAPAVRKLPVGSFYALYGWDA